MIRRSNRRWSKGRAYQIGSTVMGLWPPDCSWHTAVVTGQMKDKYRVKYTDGMERDLYEHQLKPAAADSKGQETASNTTEGLTAQTLVSSPQVSSDECGDQSCSDEVSSSELLGANGKGGVVSDASSCDNEVSSSDSGEDSDYIPSSASCDGASVVLELPGIRELPLQREVCSREADSSFPASSNQPDSSQTEAMTGQGSTSSHASSSSAVSAEAQPLKSPHVHVSSSDANHSKIRVAATNNEGSVRKWDKKHFCCYCSKPQAKVPRHFEVCHPLEPDVVQLKSKSSVARRNQLTKLRNLGNHLHNCDVLRSGEGELIVAYRPSEVDVNPHSYGPCPDCYGYYVRRDLWRHKCPLRSKGQSANTSSGRITARSDLLKPSSTDASNGLKNVLCSMKKDVVSLVVKADNLILKLGQREYMKIGHNPEQHNYLRTKLRELGRLLLHLRKNTGNPSASLEEFICPTKMTDIISAVHDVAGFNDKNHTFLVPSLSLKLGHSLKKIALIMKAGALEAGDKEKEERAEKFCQLCEYQWDVQVSTHALRTLGDSKRNNPVVLPTNADIVRMSRYLSDVGEQQLRVLRSDEDANCHHDAWNLLNETTLCQMMMFNRRRQGEVSKMKVVDFNERKRAVSSDMCPLSSVEKGLCEIMESVEIVGKRGRTVPVILTPDMTEKLAVLLQKRDSVGVAADNAYLFARSSYESLGYIRGSDCLRKHAALAQVANPQALRSTKLRKHIATASQMLALTEQQLDLLARYMGHDLRVHRDYYQIPDTVLRVAKLSKLFIALEKGILPTQQGKSLDELTIDDNSLGEDSDQSSDDEAILSYPNKEPNKENLPQEGRHEPTLPAAKGKKRPWNEDEVQAVKKLLPVLIHRLPGKTDIERVQQEHPVLRERTWRNIKDYCRNNRQKLTLAQ